MNLSIKILISLIISVIVGIIAGPGALPFIKWWVAPVGTMFINLIKMMIVPVVFTSLIVGVTSLGDTKKLGRIGLKTLVLYLLTTAIAIIIGFMVASVSHPGVGMHIANGTTQAVKAAPSIMQVILDMIPASPVQSMAKSDILPVIIFALFIGIGIVKIEPKKGAQLISFFDAAAETCYKVIAMIMELAPIGVFCCCFR
jgi:Na+/H+-dicarboxylate symporter